MCYSNYQIQLNLESLFDSKTDRIYIKFELTMTPRDVHRLATLVVHSGIVPAGVYRDVPAVVGRPYIGRRLSIRPIVKCLIKSGCSAVFILKFPDFSMSIKIQTNCSPVVYLRILHFRSVIDNLTVLYDLPYFVRPLLLVSF